MRRKFSRVPRSRLLTGEISVTGMFFSYEHNFPVWWDNFLTCQQLFNSIVFSVTSQPETFPGKRDNVSPYEQNKSIWLVEKFSR